MYFVVNKIWQISTTEKEKIKRGNIFSGIRVLNKGIIMHKTEIIMQEESIIEKFRYKTPIAFRTGRRKRTIDKRKHLLFVFQKLFSNFKDSDGLRLYSIKKNINVKVDIAIVSGIIDKG